MVSRPAVVWSKNFYPCREPHGLKYLLKDMNTLLTLLQCGAFILIPFISFSIGLWLIIRFVGINSRKSLILLAVLIGFSFFEAAAIGMLIDPKRRLLKIISNR